MRIVVLIVVIALASACSAASSTTSARADRPTPATEATAVPNAEPAEPAPSTEPAEPTPSTEPAEPTPSTEPAEPTPNIEPAEPTPNIEPAGAPPNIEPSEPTPSTEPAEPTPSTEPAEPTPSTEPAEPTPNIEPAEPTPAGSTGPGSRELEPDEIRREMQGQSMSPTVEPGDAVIASTVAEAQVGDLVLFRPPPGTGGADDLLKRVVASGGQTVTLVDGRLLVDGVEVDEPYLAEPDVTRPQLFITGCAGDQPFTDRCEIRAGTFFVLGDNRLLSADSRVYGPIDAASIVAVVTEVHRGAD